MIYIIFCIWYRYDIQIKGPDFFYQNNLLLYWSLNSNFFSCICSQFQISFQTFKNSRLFYLINKTNGFLVFKNSIEPNWKILFKTKTKPEPNNFLNSDPNPNQTQPKPNQTQKNWNWSQLYLHVKGKILKSDGSTSLAGKKWTFEEL